MSPPGFRVDTTETTTAPTRITPGGCETEPLYPRRGSQKRVAVKGEWEWLKCYKFTDSLGNVFYAPEREGIWYATRKTMDKRYEFDVEEHPNAVQKFSKDAAPIWEYRWFQRTKWVWITEGKKFQPCDIDEPNGECRRYKWPSSGCYGCSWCNGPGVQQERHSTKQRLKELKYDYNSGYDVEDEEAYFTSTGRYSQDVSWYC